MQTDLLLQLLGKMIDDIYTIEELAALLKKSSSWLREMKKQKRITPGLKDQHGRYYWHKHAPLKLGDIKPVKKGWVKGKSRKKGKP